MSESRNPPFLRLLLCVCVLQLGCATSQAIAQASDPLASVANATAGKPSADPTRLQLLESTYLANLRKFHTPILVEYLRDLEHLKQVFVSKDRTADVQQIDAEIAKVKLLGNTTGIFDIQPPKKPDPPSVDARAAVGLPKSNVRFGEDAIALQAADAQITSSITLPLSTSIPKDAIRLGQAVWQVPKLPAGNYDLIILYSCSKLDGARGVTAHFAGSDYTRNLTANQVTTSDDSFRIFRIAQFTLDHEVTDEPLTLQADEPGKPLLWLKSVIFTKPKGPKAPK